MAFWNLLLRHRVRQVTEALRESEHRHRSVIESSPDMIMVVDAEGDVLRANAAFFRKVQGNRGKEDSFPVNLHSLVGPEQGDKMSRLLERVQAEGAAEDALTMVFGNREFEVDLAATVVTDRGVDW